MLKNTEVTATSVHKSGKGSTEKVEAIPSGPPTDQLDANPATAEVSIAHTRNLGNYESLRVSVDVTIPCNADEIEATIGVAQSYAETNLARIFNEWLHPEAKKQNSAEQDDDF